MSQPDGSEDATFDAASILTGSEDAVAVEKRTIFAESLAKIMSGDLTVNSEELYGCVASLEALIVELRKADAVAQANKAQLKEAAGELLGSVDNDVLQSLAARIVEFIDLANDEVTVAPDVFRKNRLIKFRLGQVINPAVLGIVSRVAAKRMELLTPSTPSSNRSLISALSSFGRSLRGFSNSNFGPAIDELKKLSNINDSIDIVLGPAANTWSVEATPARSFSAGAARRCRTASKAGLV
jgi:hypothetical protein